MLRIAMLLISCLISKALSLRFVGKMVSGAVNAAQSVNQARTSDPYANITSRKAEPSELDLSFPHKFDVRDSVNEIQKHIEAADLGAISTPTTTAPPAPDLSGMKIPEITPEHLVKFVQSMGEQQASLNRIETSINDVTERVQDVKKTMVEKRQESAGEGNRKKVLLTIDYTPTGNSPASDPTKEKTEDLADSADDEEDDEGNDEGNEKKSKEPRYLVTWETPTANRRKATLVRIQNRPDTIMVDGIDEEMRMLERSGDQEQLRETVDQEWTDAVTSSKRSMTQYEYTERLQALDTDLKESAARASTAAGMVGIIDHMMTQTA